MIRTVANFINDLFIVNTCLCVSSCVGRMSNESQATHRIPSLPSKGWKATTTKKYTKQFFQSEGEYKTLETEWLCAERGKETPWEEEEDKERKRRALVLRPTGGFAFMELEKKRAVFGTCQVKTVQRRQQSTTINTHWQFSVNSKHIYFETCQELRNYSRLKASNSSS